MRAATPGDALVADKAAAVAPQPNAASEATVSHIGKVFFTLGGTGCACSGNAIASSNESTVATAGH